MNMRISAFREAEDPRLALASIQPHRRGLVDPLDPKAECPLGRMRLKGRITEAEYQAGVRWRTIYHNWLRSIGAPGYEGATIDDELAEAIQRSMRAGEAILKNLGTRVFHSVNAVAVYEEELGDSEVTEVAAKKGLAALSAIFG